MGKLICIKINNDVKPLYDIEIEHNNNFVVNNGIVIHNSEQYLDDQGNCDLASIFCDKFYDPENKYNKDKLNDIAISINRFLDNVITMQLLDKRYATYEQGLSLESIRRTGAGLTDIGALLLLNGMEYDSIDACELMSSFMDDYNYYLYKASIELGREKGSFLAFDKNKYLTSGFIKHMQQDHPDLTFDYMRNVCVTSIAPCGTLNLTKSTLPFSYGIEPAFGIYYWKRTRISGKYEYYFCVPRIVRDIFKTNGYKIPINSDSIKDTWDGKYGIPIAKFIDEHKNKIGINFKNATEISAMNKLNLMSDIQKNVDSSISVTYLLPESSTISEVYDFIIGAWKNKIKSISVFTDKKLYGIISYIPFKDLAFKFKSEGVEMHPQNFDDKELKELNIVQKTIDEPNMAIKRPKRLLSDIYSVTVSGEKFVVAIGLLNNSPYEIFCGKMNGLNFKFTHKTGFIEKVKKGQYKLEIGEDIVIEDFSGYFKPVEANLFRMVSIGLRHRVPLKFIVEQLNKSSEDISSLTSAAARVLKKYIATGEIVNGIKCPSCGSAVIYDETGCNKCVNCSWSKCS